MTEPEPSWKDRPWEQPSPQNPAGMEQESRFRRWFLQPKPTTDAQRAAHTERRRHDARVTMMVVGAAALLLIYMIAKQGASGSDDSSPAAISPGKYDQTWSQSYSSTTCAEWDSEMTADEQWAAAADMLTGARNKGDGGTGLPPDSLVSTFRGGIITACVIDTMSIAEVGAGLYLTERSRFAP